MSKQASHPSEQLVQARQFWYEMVNYYFGALQHLTLNDDDASKRWRELNGKLSTALVEFRQASDQLRRFEQEHASVRSVQH